MSGVECFLCLGEQEDMSSLGGHLASHHKISHEADVILLLQQCSQKERQSMTRELIKPDPVVVSQNTPPASPNVKAPTVEDLVEEATKENTEEEPKDKALTVEDLEAEATEENTEEEPKERPVLRNNWIREVAQEIKTSKRKSLNLCTNAVKKRYVSKNKNLYMHEYFFFPQDAVLENERRGHGMNFSKII